MFNDNLKNSVSHYTKKILKALDIALSATAATIIATPVAIALTSALSSPFLGDNVEDQTIDNIEKVFNVSGAPLEQTSYGSSPLLFDATYTNPTSNCDYSNSGLYLYGNIIFETVSERCPEDHDNKNISVQLLMNSYFGGALIPAKPSLRQQPLDIESIATTNTPAVKIQ